MNSIDQQTRLQKLASVFGIDLTPEPAKTDYSKHPDWQPPLSRFANPALFPSLSRYDNSNKTIGTHRLHIGPLGIALIQHFEDLRLKAYKDATGTPTIGWGTTVYLDGTPVKIGDTVTEEEAAYIFKKQLINYENMVKKKVTRPMFQHEFDAAVSFAYNAGTGYRSKGRYFDFKLWEYIQGNTEPNLERYWRSLAVTSKGKPLAGLVRRRKSEAHLYATGELNFFI